MSLIVDMSKNSFSQKVEAISELCTQSQDEWEFCRRLVYSSVFETELSGCTLAYISNVGEIEYRAKFGQIEVKDLGNNIWDNSLVANCIRAQKAHCVPLDINLDDPMNVLSIPLFFSKTPIGVVLITSRTDLSKINDEILFLFASLVGFVLKHGFRQGTANQSGVKLIDSPDPLSSRQVRVLELMALNLTNAEIARELMMSESTIRQESIRIYKALGVSDRKSAVKRGMEFGFLSQTEKAAY